MGKLSEIELIADVERRLVGRFSEVSAERVSATVTAAHNHFISGTVRDYIGLLVERRATSQLQAGFHGR